MMVLLLLVIMPMPMMFALTLMLIPNAFDSGAHAAANDVNADAEMPNVASNSIVSMLCCY